MQPNIPRAIIFDWDNTLVDVWEAIADAANVVRKAYGQSPWTIEEVKKNSTRPTRQLFPEWYGDDWKRAYKMFYDRYHASHLSHIKALRGSEALLRWLKEQNIPAFIVSNKRGDNLRAEMEHLGWSSLFSGIAGSTDAPKDKPEREPVDHALAKAGLKADDPSIWFIGDTHADVECARNAGCTPVLIGDKEEANRLHVPLSFPDCQEVLESLERR